MKCAKSEEAERSYLECTLENYSSLSNNHAGWNKACRLEIFRKLISCAGWNKACRVEFSRSSLNKNACRMEKIPKINKVCRME